MAVLPVSNFDIEKGVGFENQPSLSGYINKETGRNGGTVGGLAAVKQAAEITLNVERYRWQIYRHYSGMEWEGLIGQDPGYVGAELQRRLIDALTADDRITGISNYTYEVDGHKLRARFAVDTVYGSYETEQEVSF